MAWGPISYLIELCGASIPASMAALREFGSTFTVTYGDQAENHVGMQKIGQMAAEGFSPDELREAQFRFEQIGCECELVDLAAAEDVPAGAQPAAILVVRGGVAALTGCPWEDMYLEQSRLPYDQQAFMYGRVVNKRARYNLCFADFSQEPDYAAGRGRVVDFASVPLTAAVRETLPDFLGEKARALAAEGNHYYDPQKCGIGFHGDGERKKVVAVRLGAPLPLCYQWYHQGQALGGRIALELRGGDLYIMSEKASGWDWKRKKIPTLRHAAGAQKYLGL